MQSSKRLFDISVASVGLILASPLCALIAVLIKLDSPGPVLYGGIRAGQDGQPFRMLKFRTMVADAAQRGAGITTRGDPRITRVGKALRATKLDEVPQLWNVLRGDMSLVGPRPEDPRYLQYYTPAQRQVLGVLPGITGAASVRFRHEERMLDGAEWEARYVQLLGLKLELELLYLKRRSFWSDLDIIRETGMALFRGDEQADGV